MPSAKKLRKLLLRYAAAKTDTATSQTAEIENAAELGTVL